MNAVVAGSAIVGVFIYFTSVIFGGLVGIAFAFCVGAYFYWDYHKTHKKRKSKIIVPPLEVDVTKTVQPVSSRPTKWYIIIKNILFVLIETIETAFMHACMHDIHSS